MQQEARPSESHLEKFKSTVFKTAHCSLKEEHRERENKRGRIAGMMRAAKGKISSSEKQTY